MMNSEQLDKTAEHIVRMLMASNLVAVNNQRRAVGIVRQALDNSKFETQAVINQFFE
jgi:hypothetical protein